MREASVVVVGGGLAGRAAASAARADGADVVLVDEDPLAPDLTSANVPKWFGGLRAPRARTSDPRLAELEALANASVEVLPGTRVWAVFADRVVGLHDEERSWLVRAGRVVLATGSADLALPFRGWRLAAVFGALAALTFLERAGGLPGISRLAVVGAGDLAHSVASAAEAAGIAVVATVDPRRSAIERAEGPGRVEGLVVRDRGTGEVTTFPVDGICVAVGRQPAVELAEVAGCQLRPRDGGGRSVVHDAEGRTTQEGVFVAWDKDSGRRAGRAAAAPTRPIGPIAEDAHDPDELPYAAWLDLVPCPDDEAICACEDVAKETVARALVATGGSIDATKRRTRLGMGPCQGRRCSPIAFEMAGHASPIPRFRPPVRAIPLAVLATEEDVPVPKLAAFERAATRIESDVRARRVSPYLLSRFRRRADELQFRSVAQGADESEVERLAEDLEAQIRAGGAVPR